MLFDREKLEKPRAARPSLLCEGSELRQLDTRPKLDMTQNVGKAGIMKRALMAFNHRSDEHTSELQSLMRISYAVFCLKKKNKKDNNRHDSRHNITKS